MKQNGGQKRKTGSRRESTEGWMTKMRQMRDCFHFQVASGFCRSGFQSAAFPKGLSGPLTAPNNILTALSLHSQNTPLMLTHTKNIQATHTHTHTHTHTQPYILNPSPRVNRTEWIVSIPLGEWIRTLVNKYICNDKESKY